MPQRAFSRETLWLVPPSLEEWVAADHPVRFIADVLDDFDAATWDRLGIRRDAADRGAPRYAPELLLAVWVYGVSVGIRSCRGLETACREQIPFRWLTGNQTPDHNTLYRFLKHHPQAMTALYAETVRIAVAAGLVDWAVQAVDGTKIGANAARERSLTAAELDHLEATLDARIAAILAEVGDRQVRDDPGPPTLPPALQAAQARQARIRQARQALADRRQTANLTDPDARVLPTRQGARAAYNAQAVVSVVPAPAPDQPTGRLIVATTVTTAANDTAQLPGMIAQATAMTGQAAAVTVADAGYHTAAALAACAAAGQVVVVPEPGRRSRTDPARVGLDAFVYDAASDTYTCPAGQPLPFKEQFGEGDRQVRQYRAADRSCQGCARRTSCLSPGARHRSLKVPVGRAQVLAHRAWMATDQARQLTARRQGMIEPVFGILKERLGAGRFLRRGLDAVTGEWALVCAAFNLRTLARYGHPGGSG